MKTDFRVLFVSWQIDSWAHTRVHACSHTCLLVWTLSVLIRTWVQLYQQTRHSTGQITRAGYTAAVVATVRKGLIHLLSHWGNVIRYSVICPPCDVTIGDKVTWSLSSVIALWMSRIKSRLGNRSFRVIYADNHGGRDACCNERCYFDASSNDGAGQWLVWGNLRVLVGNGGSLR